MHAAAQRQKDTEERKDERPSGRGKVKVKNTSEISNYTYAVKSS